MKNHLLVFIAVLLALSANALAQSVGINEDGSAPSAKAMLDVKSTTKGFLPPRMTQAERNAIENPDEGLIVYNTTTKRPNFFNGTIWMNYDGTHAMAIGDACQGGVIVYFFQDGDSRYVSGEAHGIICSTVRFGAYEWGCQGTNIPASGQTLVGYADMMSTAILAPCTDPDIAAAVCDTLSYNGFTDWYLPTRDELLQIIAQKNYIPDFTAGVFYTCNQNNATTAFAYIYNPGTAEHMSTVPKSNAYHFYPIRYF